MKVEFLFASYSNNRYIVTVHEEAEDAIFINNVEVNLKDADSIRLAIELLEKMELVTIAEAQPVMKKFLIQGLLRGFLPDDLEEKLCSEQYLKRIKAGTISWLKDLLDEIVKEMQNAQNAQNKRMSDLADEYIKNVVYPAYTQHGADVSQLKNIKDVLLDYSKWLLNK